MEGGNAMVSHLFFYQLVLLGLLWLCCMLHYAWPSGHAADLQRLPQPLPPPRKLPRAPSSNSNFGFPVDPRLLMEANFA